MGEGVARVVQRGGAVKLCVDCVHYRERRLEHDLCFAPMSVDSVSPVDGSVRYLSAQFNRIVSDRCGISAQWFQPNPPKRKWWRLWA
jgi:hypothetical protein